MPLAKITYVSVKYDSLRHSLHRYGCEKIKTAADEEMDGCISVHTHYNLTLR